MLDSDSPEHFRAACAHLTPTEVGFLLAILEAPKGDRGAARHEGPEPIQVYLACEDALRDNVGLIAAADILKAARKYAGTSGPEPGNR